LEGIKWFAKMVTLEIQAISVPIALHKNKQQKRRANMSDQEDIEVKQEDKTIENINEKDEKRDDEDLKDTDKISSLKTLGPFIAGKENSKNTI